jgi:hypothetical protein
MENKINAPQNEVDLLNSMQKQVYRLLFNACNAIEKEQNQQLNDLLHRPWHEAPKTQKEIENERKENEELLIKYPDMPEIPINPNKIVYEQPNKELTAIEIAGTFGLSLPGLDDFAVNWFYHGGKDKLVLIETLSKNIITTTVEGMQGRDRLTESNLKNYLLQHYSNENCATFSSWEAFTENCGDQWQEFLKDRFILFFRRYFKYLSQVWKKDNTPPPDTVGEQGKGEKAKYTYNTTLIAQIYELSNPDVFVCSDTEFMQCVGNADFSGISIKKIAKMKQLIYRLSTKMQKEWYEKAAASLGYTKQQCSGANVADTDLWLKSINKILPKPQK